MVHVVDYCNTDVRHMDHWSTVVPDALRDAGHDVNVIYGTNPARATSDWNLLGEIQYKTTQFEGIYEEIVTGGVSPGDIFIFGDAWNPTTISLQYIKYVNSLDIKMIGFWRDGTFDPNSKVNRGMLGKPKRWAKTFERSLFTTYDYNCFISDRQRERFVKRYNLKPDYAEVLVTGLPYENMRAVRASYPDVEKEDIIVLPHDAVDQDQRDIFKALRNHLKDFTFVDCTEMDLTSDEYYSILNRAKGMLAINMSETDPTNIYEGLLFGCVPIIPDALIYNEMFSDQYKYPTYYTQPPFLNFVRGREFMHDRVAQVVHNYDEASKDLERHAIEIGDKYFKNEGLLTLIDKIKKEDSYVSTTKGKRSVKHRPRKIRYNPVPVRGR